MKQLPLKGKKTTRGELAGRRGRALAKRPFSPRSSQNMNATKQNAVARSDTRSLKITCTCSVNTRLFLDCHVLFQENLLSLPRKKKLVTDRYNKTSSKNLNSKEPPHFSSSLEIGCCQWFSQHPTLSFSVYSEPSSTQKLQPLFKIEPCCSEYCEQSTFRFLPMSNTENEPRKHPNIFTDHLSKYITNVSKGEQLLFIAQV